MHGTGIRAACLVAVVCLAGGATASTLEAPRSARGEAETLPVELVDERALLFVFPQLHATRSSEIIGLGLSDGQQGVVGSIGAGEARAFATSHRVASMLGTVRQWRGGLAFGRDRGARGGLSAAWTRRRTLQERESSGDPRQAILSERVLNDLTASMGIGATGRRVVFDVVVAATRPDRTVTSSRTLDDVSTRSETSSAHDLLLSAATRARLRTSRRTTVSVYAAWNDASETLSIRNDIAPFELDTDVDRYADVWKAAFMVAHRPERDRRIAFGVEYSDADAMNAVAGTLDAARHTTRTTTASLSLWEDLTRDVSAGAGIETSHVWMRSTTVDVVHDGREERDRMISETNAERFAWGFEARKDRMTFTGAVRTSLTLTDPFFLVDARFAL